MAYGSISLNTPLSFLVEKYLEYYSGAKRNTARAKQGDLFFFLDFLAQLCAYSSPSKLQLGDWTEDHSKRFLEYCEEKGERPSTRARRLATLKHLGNELHTTFPTFHNPCAKLLPPIRQQEKPPVLSPLMAQQTQQRAQHRIGERNSFSRHRNAVLFQLLLESGLRGEEIRLLKRSQLDESLEWISGLRSKADSYRNIPLTKKLKRPLGRYLKLRGEKLDALWPERTPLEDAALPLFISSYKNQKGCPETFFMGEKSVWRAIAELGKRGQLSPHLLRHTYAERALKRHPTELKEVAKLLGHQDLRTTKRYLEKPLKN